MKLLDDRQISIYRQTSDGQHMAEETINAHVVLHWLRALGPERLFVGSFRETVSSGISEDLLHEFSLASAMSWTQLIGLVDHYIYWYKDQHIRSNRFEAPVPAA